MEKQTFYTKMFGICNPAIVTRPYILLFAARLTLPGAMVYLDVQLKNLSAYVPPDNCRFLQYT